MSKVDLLNSIDERLFGNTVNSLREIYQVGKRLNKGKTYSYYYFKDSLDSNPSGFAMLPCEAARDYLDTKIEEYNGLIKSRRYITAYLTRFLNQCSDSVSIVALLPEQYSRDFPELILNSTDSLLVGQFKHSEEFNMIKRQHLFNSMGL